MSELRHREDKKCSGRKESDGPVHRERGLEVLKALFGVVAERCPRNRKSRVRLVVNPVAGTVEAEVEEESGGAEAVVRAVELGLAKRLGEVEAKRASERRELAKVVEQHEKTIRKLAQELEQLRREVKGGQGKGGAKERIFRPIGTQREPLKNRQSKESKAQAGEKGEGGGDASREERVASTESVEESDSSANEEERSASEEESVSNN